MAKEVKDPLNSSGESQVSAAAAELLNKHQANISRLAQAFGLADKLSASQKSDKSAAKPDSPAEVDQTPAKETQAKARDLEESIAKVKTPFDKQEHTQAKQPAV